MNCGISARQGPPRNARSFGFSCGLVNGAARFYAVSRAHPHGGDAGEYPASSIRKVKQGGCVEAA